jgi:hypothetical protein
MGHQRLGVLPRSREWQRVVALIADGAGVEIVAAETARAAETSMIDASGDPAVRHAFWLLTQIPLVAREAEFERGLRQLGIRVQSEPTLAEITSAMMDAVDGIIRQTRGRTDFGEMAQLCAAESLSAIAGSEARDLFGETVATVKSAFAELATAKQFSVLARDYIAQVNTTAPRLLYQPRTLSTRRPAAAVQNRSGASRVRRSA